MTVEVEFSINTVDLEVKYLYNHLNAAAICLRTSATQFSATTSISTLEPITGRKSETAIVVDIHWNYPDYCVPLAFPLRSVCVPFINMHNGQVHDVTYCYNLGKKCVPPY